jgi:diguanylate cyclase (GGDEF)-like protein/PAS domain S-box-containing protein
MTARSRGPQGRERHPVAVHIGVALLALTLLTGVALVAARGASQTVENDAKGRVRSNRDAAVRALVRQSDDFKRTVSTWAANAPVTDSLSARTPASLAALQDQLSTLARSKDSPLAFVSDTRGRTVALYPAQPELIGKDFSYQDWFKGASSTGMAYVSEGYRSAATGHPLVVGVTAPVLNHNRVVGYIAVLWQLDSLRSVIDGSRRDDGVTLTMTDQRGQSLTGTLTFDDRGQVQPAAVSGTTAAALAGTSVSSVRNGRLEATGPVPGLGWTVTASLPESVALAPAHTFQRSLQLTLGVALLCVLLFTGLALRVARRLAAEQSVADDERHRLTTLFAASPIGIVEAGPDTTILAVNEALAHMLGYEVSDLLGAQGVDLIHPRSAAAASQTLQGLLDGDLNAYTSQRILRARDGSAVPVQVSAVVNRDSKGAHKRTVGFVVDQREQTMTAASLKALADTLAEREALLSTLFDTMDVAVIACDAEGVSTMVNHQGRAMHGMTDDMAADTPGAMRMTHLDGRPMDPADSPLRRALVEGEVRDVELHVVTDDGRAPQRLLMHARRMTGLHGETVGAVVAAHDVTAMRASEGALRASEDRFRRVFDEGLTGKFLANTDGNVLRVNATLSSLLGSEPEQLIGQPVVSLFNDPADQLLVLELMQAGDGELRAEMAMSDANGRWLWGLVALSWLTEHDGPRVLLGQIEDITARRDAEQRLTELTLHDELTGLPNRRLLLERCDRAFAHARSGRGTNTTVAALFIDLDGFKQVNDRAGHDTGDQLLIAIAHDLQTALRPSDTVARVGGDEFVVLLEQEDGLEYLRTVADRITTAVRRQVTADGTSLAVSASVGIARVDLAIEPDLPPDQLLRRADAAMYRAKERGRDRHDVFDAELHDRTEARQALEQAMRDGLLNDRVALVFQPVIDVDSGIVVGAEALMRLKNAQGRLLPTLPAIVAAETAGLAEALGDRVLQLALKAASTWPSAKTLAVNVSARELTGKDLRNRVEQALLRHEFDPRRLILEITESSILSAGPSALAELEKLRDRGVRVAIDDFGTAYATLQNLTTLQVDALKVDTSFTAGLPDQRTHTAVVHGIASMAYELDIPCIIEGIETEKQLAAIRGMAVQAQGWFWGKPQGPEHVPVLRQVPSARINLAAASEIVAAEGKAP